MTIAVYDTYCGSLNSGDAVIMDAVYGQSALLFPFEHKVAYPTHFPLSLRTIRKIKESQLIIVGGSNLLNSKINLRSKKNQWAVGFLDALFLRDRAVLFGCGWGKYQQACNLKGKLLYNTILSKSYLHSVRDSYSEVKLREIGLTNVINTACPTLWMLNGSHCRTIPTQKADHVVFTLTDYRRHPEADANFVRLLLSSYEKAYFWIQGANDIAYLKSLIDPSHLDKIHLTGPSLAEYDQLLLDEHSLDYVGTRLHAGIRAMQKKRRSIIIGVDNRAIEKRDDFNLMVVERQHIAEKLPQAIYSPFDTKINLPIDNINTWRKQFNPSLEDLVP